VLNHFNGDGMGGGFPGSARGASSPVEWSARSAKIVSAIAAIDADVGLIEMENDGDGANWRSLI